MRGYAILILDKTTKTSPQSSVLICVNLWLFIYQSAREVADGIKWIITVTKRQNLFLVILTWRVSLFPVPDPTHQNYF